MTRHRFRMEFVNFPRLPLISSTKTFLFIDSVVPPYVTSVHILSTKRTKTPYPLADGKNNKSVRSDFAVTFSACRHGYVVSEKIYSSVLHCLLALLHFTVIRLKWEVMTMDIIMSHTKYRARIFTKSKMPERRSICAMSWPNVGWRIHGSGENVWMPFISKMWLILQCNCHCAIDRNEVWRHNTAIWGNRRTRILRFLFTGIQWGFAAAVGTIAYEEYFEVYKHHGHGHGTEHGDSHH